MFTIKISKMDVTPEKWLEIEKSLELPPGRDEVIVMRIPGLLPVEAGFAVNTQIKEPDEWMIGESIDGERQWIVHCRRPRFIAEIVDDDDKLNPPFEYQMRSGQWLCNFYWFDAPPEDLTILCMETQEAIEMYDANLRLED